MISRETIDEFFENNRRRGDPLDRNMLWGYFFCSDDRSLLEAMRPIVEALGYRYVCILELEDESLMLHIERVETHTPASLYSRCRELTVFAVKHRLDAYDGFDVGNVDGSPLYPT